MRGFPKSVYFILLFITSGHGQVTVVYDSLFSPSIDSVAKYIAVLPDRYYRDTAHYHAVYLLHGYGQHYEDWINKTGIIRYAKDYPYILIIPDAGNNWYSNSITKSRADYEDLVIKDLIPFVEKKYRAFPARSGRSVVGISMGGYGAAKLGLKYGAIFEFAGCLSPGLHVPFGLEDSAIIARRSKESMQSIRDVFGVVRNSYWAENDVFLLAKKADTSTVPFIYLTVGSQDALPEVLELTYKFALLLRSQKIPFELHETAGAHNWMFWDKEIEKVLLRIAKLNSGD